MDIQIPSLIIIAGKPKSGKSYLIKYLMYQMRKKFDYGIVFTRTQFTHDMNYISPEYVHNNYYEDKLKNLMKIQSEVVRMGLNKQAFVLFDDCLSTEFSSQLFIDLITQHRHFKITPILSTQYLFKLNPTIRECASY